MAGPCTERRLRPWKTVVLSVKITSRWRLKRGGQRGMARGTVCISKKIYSLAPLLTIEVFGESLFPGDCPVVGSWDGEEETLPFCAGGACPDMLGGSLFVYERHAAPPRWEFVPPVEVCLHVGGDGNWSS